MSQQSTQESEKPVGPHRFQQGNKYAKGGKREGAGRKSKRNEVISDEIKSSARDYVRLQLEKHVGKVMSTYLRLAESGTDPTTTRHAIDKIDPEEVIPVPTITINFVAFNTAGSLTSPLPASPLDVSPTQDSGLSTQHSTIHAPVTSHDAPRLTFTDIQEKD